MVSTSIHQGEGHDISDTDQPPRPPSDPARVLEILREREGRSTQVGLRYGYRFSMTSIARYVERADGDAVITPANHVDPWAGRRFDEFRASEVTSLDAEEDASPRTPPYWRLVPVERDELVEVIDRQIEAHDFGHWDQHVSRDEIAALRVGPRIVECEDRAERYGRVWLVLSYGDDHSCCSIVYDELDGAFCLAHEDDASRCENFGDYGTFMEALDDM